MKKWIGKIQSRTVDEETHKWKDVKDELTELSFINDGQIITLPKGLKYIQGKTASTIIGTNHCEIESRYIGYTIGNITNVIRINEKTSKITVEIINDNFTKI